MIRDAAALKLAQDILPDDAPAMQVQLIASLIVVRVKNDELEQAYEARETLGGKA